MGVALAILLAACGSDDQPRIETDASSASRPAAELAELDPSTLPTDADAALEVLDELPDEIVGLRRMADRSEGEVRYGVEGNLFLAVMEASDIGVSDETNAELLLMEARREGRTVTAQETDESAPLLYVSGTEGDPPLHFLLWTTADNSLVFAAGADSARNLRALLRAFTESAT